ncbi:MAG: aspartyl aminopeptidase [Cellvibrionaceae bacterium]|jgi:aspartyl aminopeptidase
MSKELDSRSLTNGLLTFLGQSPTPFHAVATMTKHLLDSGFEKLNEADQWSLTSGKGYFLTRNDSSIIAFRYLPELMQDQGIAMLGAHTDSPCLKVKPNPDKNSHGYWQLGVETYGGVLLNPWFDRDLSIAGRVTYLNTQEQLSSCLIDFVKPIAVIPSLAIHLNREANTQNKINAQTHLPPILAQVGKCHNNDFRQCLQEQIASEGISNCKKVLDYDLCFYDTQAPAIIGFNEDFVASARLDNLLSCYLGLQALLTSDKNKPALLVCNDHEEVGSASACGAQGPMLAQCLQRLFPDHETRLRLIDRSMMISIDNAHGIHPNYADMHDSQHGPILNKGPVIKVNANQRYATNSETSSAFKYFCDLADVPVQEFVTRSDLGCGSTIGPITATEIGVKTVDIGLPTFAMHSIRELAGSKDSQLLLAVLCEFIASR